MYDQDFINDGYDGGRALREPIICPACGHKATRIVSVPDQVRICLARTKRKACGVAMVRDQNPKRNT